MEFTNNSDRSFYFSVDEDAERCGLNVVSFGRNIIDPNFKDPTDKDRQPPESLFDRSAGRVLEEYQIVYISEGQGAFESSQTGSLQIEAGQVFVLFPGIWHRFRPDQATGWVENWIGFNGLAVDRIMPNFFEPSNAVLQLGHDLHLLSLFEIIKDTFQQSLPGYQWVMAARTLEALVHISANSKAAKEIEGEIAEKIERARRFVHEHFTEEIDAEELARSLGISYSRFRTLFKKYVGSAPHDYQLQLRMDEARQLLNNRRLPIGQISDQLGFSSAHYFTRLFNKRNGCSPSKYRAKRFGRKITV